MRLCAFSARNSHRTVCLKICPKRKQLKQIVIKLSHLVLKQIPQYKVLHQAIQFYYTCQLFSTQVNYTIPWDYHAQDRVAILHKGIFISEKDNAFIAAFFCF